MLKRMESLLKAFGKCRVLLAGDLMLDEYCRGHIDRISQEAPVPILSVVDRTATLGGAGNVVQNLRSLGVEVAVVGVTGNDATGDHIAELLEAVGADASGVMRDPERKSTRKVRYVSLEHGQQVFRVDEETPHPISAGTEHTIAEVIRDRASAAQVILCSDYLKGVLTEGVLKSAFSSGRARRIPTIVAPKDTDPRKYAGANILMPNVRELSRLAGTPMDGIPWLTESATRLTQSLELEAMLVTRGKEGMSLFELSSQGLQRIDIPTVARNVYDVTGAGDTAIATFAAAVAAGAGWVTSAQLANVAAGVVVGKRGTASVTSEEILEHISTHGTRTEFTQEVHRTPCGPQRVFESTN